MWRYLVHAIRTDSLAVTWLTFGQQDNWFLHVVLTSDGISFYLHQAVSRRPSNMTTNPSREQELNSSDPYWNPRLHQLMRVSVNNAGLQGLSHRQHPFQFLNLTSWIQRRNIQLIGQLGIRESRTGIKVAIFQEEGGSWGGDRVRLLFHQLFTTTSTATMTDTRRV